MTLALRIREPQNTESLSHLRPEVEDSLRTVLLRYHIPELDAESLLRETVLEMLYKSEGPRDFGRRVGPVLQAKCRVYWQTRRWRCFNTLAQSQLNKETAMPQTNAIPKDKLRARGSLSHRIRTALRALEG